MYVHMLQCTSSEMVANWIRGNLKKTKGKPCTKAQPNVVYCVKMYQEL